MNPLTIIAIVVSLAAFIMLAINLYLALKHNRKDGVREGTAVLHQRIDTLTKLVSEQLEENKRIIARLVSHISDEHQK